VHVSLLVCMLANCYIHLFTYMSAYMNAYASPVVVCGVP